MLPTSLYHNKQGMRTDMKLVSIMLALMLLISMTACANQQTVESENTSLQISSSEISSSGEDIMSGIPPSEEQLQTQEILEKSSMQDLHPLINHAYSQQDLLSMLYYNGSDNFNTQLQNLNAKFPVECIRTFEDAATYCIYRLKEGGYLYVYFDSHYDGAPPYDPTLKFARYVFVVKKKLTRSNFSHIKPGTPISEVEEIDPGRKLINEISPVAQGEMESCHMVENGFMKITYESTNKDMDRSEISDIKEYCKTLVVKSIEFIPNGGDVITDFYDQKVAFRILPQDYIQ